MIVPVFLVVAVLAGVSDSASSCFPGRCCTPDEWQGLQGSESGYVYHGEPGKILGVMYVFYDYKNQRTASFANYTSKDGPRHYKIVQRYECETFEKDCYKGKLYVVDLESNKCYKRELERPFRRACTPANATETGAFYYGAGEATLNARGYRVKVRSENYKLDVSLSVSPTEDECTCIPVGETVTGIARGVPIMETVGFVNIKPEIKDKSVFKVPEQCETGTHPAEIMMMLHREHSLLAV